MGAGECAAGECAAGECAAAGSLTAFPIAVTPLGRMVCAEKPFGPDRRGRSESIPPGECRWADAGAGVAARRTTPTLVGRANPLAAALAAGLMARADPIDASPDTGPSSGRIDLAAVGSAGPDLLNPNPLDPAAWTRVWFARSSCPGAGKCRPSTGPFPAPPGPAQGAPVARSIGPWPVL